MIRAATELEDVSEYIRRETKLNIIGALTDNICAK